MEHPCPIRARAALLALLLCGLAIAAIAQRPAVRQLTTADGLLHQEVTSVYYSPNSGLWMAYSANNTLSRFDGAAFTDYDLAQLKLPFPVYPVYEDKQGLWFLHEQGNALAVYKDGRWRSVRLEGSFYYYVDEASGAFRLIGKDMQLYRLDEARFRFEPHGAPLKLKVQAANLDWKLYRFPAAEGYYLEFFDTTANRWAYYATTLEPGSTPEYLGQCVKENNLRFYAPGRYLEFSFADGRVYYQEGNKRRPIPIRLPNGKEGKVLSSYCIQSPERVSATQKFAYLVAAEGQKGKYLYTPTPEGGLALRGGPFPDLIDVQAAELPSGELWIGSNAGLFRANTGMLEFTQEDENMVAGLHIICEDGNGDIWLGGYTDSGFARFDGRRLSRPEDPALHKLRVLPGGMADRHGNILFFHENSGGIGAIEGGRFRHYAADTPKFMGFMLRTLSNGQLAAGYSELALLDSLSSPLRYRSLGRDKGLQLTRVHTITEDAGGRLWLGRYGEGAALYDPQRDTFATWLFQPDQPGTFGILSSMLDENGILWLGANRGLYYLPQPEGFDYRSQNLFRHTSRIRLPGGDTTTVFFLTQHEGNVVAGTERAIHFISLAHFRENPLRPLTHSLFYGSDIDGNGSEQNAVLTDSRGYLWAGTHEGALRMDVKSLAFDTMRENIQLLSFRAGDGLLALPEKKQRLKLPKGRRNIEFAFRSSGNALLQNKVFFDVLIVSSGGDTLFQVRETQEQRFAIPYLPPQKYRLEIYSHKHNQLQDHLSLPLAVPKVLEENVVLWLGLLLAFLLWLFIAQNRRWLKNQKLKREQDRLKAQAAANFFNPHFINNTLHWLQSRYRKDEEMALVIEKLASNMAQLTRVSRAGRAYHSLQEEFELVEDYLAVQQARFSHRIQATMPSTPQLRTLEGVMVLVMQVQVHVENAIEHGIRNREGAGRLNIALREEAGYVIITIEDDGQGRRQPNAREQAGQASSTAMVNDLAAIYNQYNAQKIQTRYEDFVFSSEAGRACFGTRVIITIPKQYNYELR